MSKLNQTTANQVLSAIHEGYTVMIDVEIAPNNTVSIILKTDTLDKYVDKLVNLGEPHVNAHISHSGKFVIVGN